MKTPSATAKLIERVTMLCVQVEQLAQTIKSRDVALEQMRLERDRWKGHAEQFIIDNTPFLPPGPPKRRRKRTR